MRNHRGRIGLVVMLGLALSLVSTAGLAANSSIEARLKARDITYEVDADGDYKVTYSYDKEERSQMVFVAATIESVGDLKVREVYAAAGKVDEDRIDGAMALKLMEESQTKKIGSWELSGNVLLYVIKVPDGIDAEGLEAVMKIAAELADNKEMELSGRKDAL